MVSASADDQPISSFPPAPPAFWTDIFCTARPTFASWLLRDTVDMYVAGIQKQSVGGFLPTHDQVFLDSNFLTSSKVRI